jgi:thiol-disulfide isomerase/thioredoxin
MQKLDAIDEGQDAFVSGAPVLLYFSGRYCSVCAALKPKLASMVSQRFPEIQLFEITSEEHPQWASRFGVFSVPTVLVFFDGREYLREGRNMSLPYFAQQLERIYRLWLGSESK